MLGINVNRAKDVTTSVLASTLAGWKGSSASRKVKQPQQEITLYDREGCARCRMVREAITELNLDVNIIPVPLGGERFHKQLKAVSGVADVPFLLDENTGERLRDSDNIVEYLFQTYAGKAMPERLRSTPRNLALSKAATVVRGSHGLEAIPSKPAEKPLILYSFESSPYSRLVRELLCELQLPYRLINIGKQQRADVGPANFRLHLGEYKPLPNTKRSEFFAQHGNVQVPYLIDPNTGVDLFESDDIVKYLKRTYRL